MNVFFTVSCVLNMVFYVVVHSCPNGFCFKGTRELETTKFEMASFYYRYIITLHCWPLIVSTFQALYFNYLLLLLIARIQLEIFCKLP